MDINDMRSLVTVVSLVLFLAITVWTWQRSRKDAFDEAAGLPFAGEANEPATGEPK
ncbi:MAG: CcoQ/FixQ family Cbb3-type cytochrome c oxidase assembly chaperone [Rubrivivax sp.]|nr:CcoQ/FixQ family Cbb3-type cytochrome c oxidase assembly chaperone [Rubrivivax sp.]